MGKIILVTGGTRSGKSYFALRRGEGIDGRRCFIATCQVLDEVDEEMAERVQTHQQTRDAQRWLTIEEPLAVANIIKEHQFDVYLVDCLTLWISNYMADCAQRGVAYSEHSAAIVAEELIDIIRKNDGTVIFVSNEVGMSVVPENNLARRFRDLVGLTNRLIAAAADEVVLISCGLPIYLKKSD